MRMFMSIVKVEIKLPEAHHAIVAFAENRMLALESLASLLRSTASEVINGLLTAEIDLFFLACVSCKIIRKQNDHCWRSRPTSPANFHCTRVFCRKLRECSRLRKEKEQQEKQNETQAQKDFKAEYTTWFQGLLKTDEGKKELIAFRLNKEVRAVLVKVIN